MTFAFDFKNPLPALGQRAYELNRDHFAHHNAPDWHLLNGEQRRLWRDYEVDLARALKSLPPLTPKP